jgi:cytoskeleton protein RodZ
VAEEKAGAPGERVGGGRDDASLGQFLTAARKQGGFTPEQVAAETHIPPNYVRALETDDYTLISDQLYLLPFLRRYAAFIGLDPEDVASRFVREVQRAEVGSSKTSEPIPMISSDRKPRESGSRFVVIVLIALGALAAVLVMKRQVLLQHLIGLSNGTPSTTEPAPSPMPTANAPQAEASVVSPPLPVNAAPPLSTPQRTPSAPAHSASGDFDN